MWEEFKKFALKGNVVDLSVAVIIGAAFGKIVESVVGDLFMPVVGAVLAYGSFLTIVINFAIIAAILFIVVKAINRLKAKEAAKPEPVTPPSKEVQLLTEIRDALVKK